MPRNRVLLVFLVAAICWPVFAAEARTVLRFGGGPAWLDQAQQYGVIAAFERDNPDIKIELVPLEPPDDKFRLLIAGGQPIDVFLQAHVFGWPEYTFEGLFLNLQPFVDRDKASLPNDIPKSAWRSASVGPRLSGMAGLSPGHGVMYNATLFEQAGLALPPAGWDDPGWNWDTMAASARKLTRFYADGAVTQWGVGFWDADNLIGFACAFGGDWFDAKSYTEGVVNQVTFTNPANVRAYEAIASLRREGAQTHLGPIWEGKLGMAIEGLSPGLVDPVVRGDLMRDFRWGLAGYPYVAGVDRSRTFSWSGPSAAILSTTKHPEEAWRFVKYLATSNDPAVTAWGHAAPRTRSYIDQLRQWMEHGIAAQPYNEMLQVLGASLERAMPLPRTSVLGSTAAWNALNRELIPALNGSVPVASALEKAQQVAAAAVAELKKNMGL